MAMKRSLNRLEEFFSGFEREETPESPPAQKLPGWRWECSANGQYTFCSSDIVDCLGIPAAEFLGQPFTSFGLSPESSAMLEPLLAEAALPAEVDVEYKTAAGKWLAVRMVILPAGDQEGNEDGWQGFSQALLQPETGRLLAGPGASASESLPPIEFTTTSPLITSLDIELGELQSSSTPWSEAGRLSLANQQLIIQSAKDDSPAAISIPFNFGKYGSGIIEIVDDGPRQWSADDRFLIQEVANQLTQAMENAQLDSVLQQELAERIRAEQEIMRQAQDLALLNQIGQRLSKLATRQEIFQIIYHAFGELLDNRNLTIALYDPVNNVLAFPICTIDGQFQLNPNVPLKNGIAEYIIRNKEPLLITSQVEENLVERGIDIPERIPASILGIPMLAGDRSVGAILLFDYERENAYSPMHVDLLFTISSQATIALDNAHAYELSQKAIEEMKEVDRLKSQFLANMSHELRTPLNSIIGFSRVIMKGIDGPVNDVQQQDLTAIYNSGQHLLTLINDILDLSKIEAGKIELSFSKVNLHELIKSVLSTTTGLIKDKPIALKQNVPDDLPTITADAIRVRQVLLNFLSNAAKFTEAGSISIEAKTSTAPNGRPEIMVTVSDSGPGIAPKDQQKLFQPFSQVDDSPSRKTGGTGLGLSISRSLVEMHGGRIGLLWSEVGKGSTFFFTLPLGQES